MTFYGQTIKSFKLDSKYLEFYFTQNVHDLSGKKQPVNTGYEYNIKFLVHYQNHFKSLKLRSKNILSLWS